MATIQSMDLDSVRKLVTGEVIGPKDDVYDAARAVFAGGIDKKPAVIVRVKNTTDIIHVVKLAHETGMELAVRSGGHSAAGHSVSDGGIVIDLSPLKALHINLSERTAWAETGLTAAEYSKETGRHKLATGFGDTGSVGIGGITTGGGIGYLVRKFGLTIDDVLAADIVTADGAFHTIDNHNEPELFWAVRGGGGNFGIVTRFKYRLHDVDRVTGGMMILPATAATVTAFVREARDASNDLSAIVNVMTAPPMPMIPKELHGSPVVMAFMCHSGNRQSGEQTIQTFRSIAAPIVDTVDYIPYPAMYPPDQGGYHPIAASRTMFMDSVDTGISETILKFITSSTGSMAVCQLRVLGGAMATVSPEATAFAHRKSEIMANVAALYTDLKEKITHETWATDFMHALHQTDDGAYVNFLGNEGAARVRAAYPGKTWDRLQNAKSRYDPKNIFRLNQNIPPCA